MALRKFLAVVRRRRWYVLSAFLLCLLGGQVITWATPPSYEATAGLYFSVRSAASVDDLQQGALFTQQQMASYASLAVTPRVLEPVAEELGIDGGAAQLEQQVTAVSSTSTVVLTLTVTDGDPARAAQIANAIADQIIQVVEDLSPADPNGGESGVQVSVVAPASTPDAPASPNALLDLGAGAVLGLALGVLLALALDAVDTRIRDVESVAEVTDRPLIGSLGMWPSKADGVVMTSEPHGRAAEGFRRLRTNLQFLRVGTRPGAGANVVSVTSSLAGEGKSTVASNLAAALAETGAAVLLIDADLRRPAVARLLGVEGGAGLTTVLVGQARFDDVVVPWGDDGLDVLPAGQLPPNPAELLGSPAMRQLLDDVRSRYDYVVLDTVPLLPVTDAAVLARLVDRTLVVAQAGRVRRTQLREALDSLDRVSAPVAGLVLNRVRRDEDSYGYERIDGEGAAAPLRAGTRREVPVG